jgi:DNA-binding NarL/FixJ family response regulator
MSQQPMAEQGRKRVRVIVADDHPLYRDGVVRALLASGQVEIVAEADDGRSALASIREHLPDVALLDYKLPELDGVAVTNAIVREQRRIDLEVSPFVKKPSHRRQQVCAQLQVSEVCGGEKVRL